MMVYGNRKYYVYHLDKLENLVWSLLNCHSLTRGFRFGALLLLNDTPRSAASTQVWVVIYGGVHIETLRFSRDDEKHLTAKVKWLKGHAGYCVKWGVAADLRTTLVERGAYEPALARDS